MNSDSSGELRHRLESLRKKLSKGGATHNLLVFRDLTLVALEKAIKRYDEGNYGFCSDCHLAIPRSELLFKPYATRCNSCRQKRTGIRVGRPPLEDVVC